MLKFCTLFWHIFRNKDLEKTRSFSFLSLNFWIYDRGGTTRLGNSTRLESTSISSFNSSLTRLVHQLENSQLDSTRFLISKLDNSTSDSNANTLPKILKFTIYKMKYASLFFIFSYFLQVLMIFFFMLPSTFACWKLHF